jgi:hypothetical protein
VSLPVQRDVQADPVAPGEEFSLFEGYLWLSDRIAEGRRG